MNAYVAARESFADGEETLHMLAGIQIGAQEIERSAENTGEQMDLWMRHEHANINETKVAPIAYIEMDGTGIAMQKRELEGRLRKQPDGSAKTREVKVGCVFTQTTTDDQGRPQA